MQTCRLISSLKPRRQILARLCQYVSRFEMLTHIKHRTLAMPPNHDILKYTNINFIVIIHVCLKSETTLVTCTLVTLPMTVSEELVFATRDKSLFISLIKDVKSSLAAVTWRVSSQSQIFQPITLQILAIERARNPIHPTTHFKNQLMGASSQEFQGYINSTHPGPSTDLNPSLHNFTTLTTS